MSLSGTGSTAVDELVGEVAAPGCASAASPRPPRERRSAPAGASLRSRREHGLVVAPGRPRCASSSRRSSPRPASSGSTSGRTSSSAPSASRRTTTCGWASSVEVEPGDGDRGGDRVDQERHVVGDDRGPRCGRSVCSTCSFISPGRRCAARSRWAWYGREHLGRGAAAQVLVGHQAPEAVDQVGQVGPVAAASPPPTTSPPPPAAPGSGPAPRRASSPPVGSCPSVGSVAGRGRRCGRRSSRCTRQARRTPVHRMPLLLSPHHAVGLGHLQPRPIPSATPTPRSASLQPAVSGVRRD